MSPLVRGSDGVAPDARTLGKLHGDWAEVLRQAAPDERVPVKAILRDRVPQADIDALGHLPIRDDRRVAVRDTHVSSAGSDSSRRPEPALK
jgi:hypothetical protein